MLYEGIMQFWELLHISVQMHSRNRHISILHMIHNLLYHQLLFHFDLTEFIKLDYEYLNMIQLRVC